VTLALLCFQIKIAISGTIGQTLTRLFVKDGAAFAFPAFLANASSVNAKSMIRTSRVRTVNFFTECSCEAFDALAMAFYATSSA
jgi:hypothetical protein